MTSEIARAASKPQRPSRITLTIPQQYRPKYRPGDSLLQSSSEETPLTPDSGAVEGGTLTHPELFVGNMPPSHASPPSEVLPGSVSDRIQSNDDTILTASMNRSTTMAGWHPPAAAWTYRPPPGSTSARHPRGFPSGRPPHGLASGRFPTRHLPFRDPPAGHFQTMPRGRNQHRRRGRPPVGSYHGRNNFYIGRLSVPTIDFKSLLPQSHYSKFDKHVLMSPKSALDFFLPKVVHNSVANAFDTTENSILCSTWKGLSSVGAEELFVWTNIHDRLVQQHKSRGDYLAQLSTLAEEMVERFEKQLHEGFNWFLSAPDPLLMVERFLLVRVERPRLHIEQLNTPVVGQDYSLKPTLLSVSNGTNRLFARDIVLSTSETWLTLDQASGVFTGIVPWLQPRSITVSANVVDYLDERVRLEHVIRARITLGTDAGNAAGQYLSTIFTDFGSKTSLPNKGVESPKKVTFAEDDETNSVHSSPGHLESFLNDLSALTIDSASAGSSYAFPVASEPSRESTYVFVDPINGVNPFSAMKPDDENVGKYIPYSPLEDATPFADESKRSISRSSSLGRLSPHIPHSVIEQAGPFQYQSTRVHDNSVGCPVGQSNLPDIRGTRDGAPSRASQQKANPACNKSTSLLDDDCAGLDLEIVHGAVGPGSKASSNQSSEEDRTASTGFCNPLGPLSGCGSADCPICP